MQGDKVVLITGANRGLGYGLACSLLGRGGYKVILTSRDELKGKTAVNELISIFPGKKEAIDYHQLDISDSNSIAKCIQWLLLAHPQVDILVNNAGVYFKDEPLTLKVLDDTFATNVYGTIKITEKCLDNGLISKNGKIIVLGTLMGELKYLKGEGIKNRFRDPNLTLDKLLDLCKAFRKLVDDNTVEADGWIACPYSISKMVVNSYPKILAKRKDVIENGIQANSVHPGWVKTDMGGPEAYLSMEEGVENVLYALDIENKPEHQGQYLKNKQPYDFEA
jgi:NAD(P)-dependent dehydrogenase (short-subunit alcohol dehydrogenase family)